MTEVEKEYPVSPATRSRENEPAVVELRRSFCPDNIEFAVRHVEASASSEVKAFPLLTYGLHKLIALLYLIKGVRRFRTTF